jgi:hypothetical protein
MKRFYCTICKKWKRVRRLPPNVITHGSLVGYEPILDDRMNVIGRDQKKPLFTEATLEQRTGVCRWHNTTGKSHHSQLVAR